MVIFRIVLLLVAYQRVIAQTPVANMVRIPPGTFVMGSPTTEALRQSDEGQHGVTITYGFYIGRYQVTQGDYLALIGSNPSRFTGDLNRPVETVSWFDATNYCYQLTIQEQAAGRLQAGWAYRLPTEAEWEYSCRAGTTTAFYYGNALHSGMANFNGHGEYDAAIGTISNPNGVWLQTTTPVGSYEPNAFGLYDMHGNVQEWCQDWYGAYPTSATVDPEGPTSGTIKVVRGGSFADGGSVLRSATRIASYGPGNVSAGYGFRVVLAGIGQEYQVIDLGSLGDLGSEASFINASGQVVGGTSIKGSSWSHAFLYSNNSMQDLGTLGGVFSGASGVNAIGQVVGSSYTISSEIHAFLYSDGSMQDLNNLVVTPVSGGTLTGANGVNDSGQVVGSLYINSISNTHAFLYQGGVARDLGTLGGSYSFANAINALGQVAGYSVTNGAAGQHAFLYSNNSMRDLDTLGGNFSVAWGINNNGDVVGQAYTSNGSLHGFKWSNDSMQDLGTLQRNDSSVAQGINDRGQIVGFSYTGSVPGYHAFLYSNGSMQDLNNLVALPASGWTLTQAYAINNAGQIVGYGTNPQGQIRAFLLKPLLPTSVSLQSSPTTPAAVVLALNIQTQVGQAYVVEFKNALLDPVWNWLHTVFGDGSLQTFLQDLGSFSRFYRVHPFNPGFLSFPLHGTGKTPYTTRVTAVRDNDIAPGSVTAYDGENGSGEQLCYPSAINCQIKGFAKANGQPFTLQLLNYDDELSPSKKQYLFYDGHTGYDYAYPGILGEAIYPAALGKLVVATTTTQANGVDLWRNEAVVGTTPPGGLATLQWAQYHAIYILHPNGYSTWYLHASDLEPRIKARIVRDGYADVTPNDAIAYVGDFGVEPRVHLHFGLRKGDILDDPYGDIDSHAILWDTPPP